MMIKKLSLIFGLYLLLSLSLPKEHQPCGQYKGRNIYKGKDGGCYYLKGKAHKKVYIDRKNCKCK